MALTVTLEQLRTDSLLYADQRPGGANEFVGTTDLDRLINQQIRKWQDLLIAQRPPDQVIQHQYFNIVGGDAGYSFAANDLFYAIVTAQLFFDNAGSVDVAKDVEDFNRIAWKDTYRFTGQLWGRGLPKGYTIGEGSPENIVIYPTPTSACKLFVRYIQHHAALVASPGSPNTIVTYNGWEMFIAMGVAMQLLAIAGRDSSHLRVLWEDERKRLESLASERIVCEAKEVRDVYPEWGQQRGWPWNLPQP